MNQNERKRERAKAVMLNNPNLSDRALAELADVAHPFIGKVRKLLEKEGIKQTTQKRLGKDGKCRRNPTGRKRDLTPILVEHQHNIVYFIRAEQTGLIKIGKAEELAKRFHSLQVINSEPLSVIYAIPGGYELETKLHHKFKDLCHHGEWFVPGKELLDFIENGVE